MWNLQSSLWHLGKWGRCILRTELWECRKISFPSLFLCFYPVWWNIYNKSPINASVQDRSHCQLQESFVPFLWKHNSSRFQPSAALRVARYRKVLQCVPRANTYFLLAYTKKHHHITDRKRIPSVMSMHEAALCINTNKYHDALNASHTKHLFAEVHAACCSKFLSCKLMFIVWVTQTNAHTHTPLCWRLCVKRLSLSKDPTGADKEIYTSLMPRRMQVYWIYCF